MLMCVSREMRLNHAFNHQNTILSRSTFMLTMTLICFETHFSHFQYLIFDYFLTTTSRHSHAIPFSVTTRDVSHALSLIGMSFFNAWSSYNDSMSCENSHSAKRIKQSFIVTGKTEAEIKADFVNLFSDELILHVFQYLDAKDLSACARVSSHWHRLVNDPQVRIQDHYHDCFYFLFSFSYSLAFRNSSFGKDFFYFASMLHTNKSQLPGSVFCIAQSQHITDIRNVFACPRPPLILRIGKISIGLTTTGKQETVGW